MPWCDDCAKFWNPPSVGAGGACPSCGAALQGGGAGQEAQEELPEVPWHFKLLVLATVLYLALRAYQGVAWLLDRI